MKMLKESEVKLMNEIDYKVNGYQIITQFCTHFNHFKRHSEIHSDELDTLLYIANANHEVTPIMLTQYFNVSKPRITKIINELQKKQLIDKKPSLNDKRSQVLLISKLGLELLSKMHDECYAIIDQLVDELGFGDFIQLLELMNRANVVI